MNLGQKIKSGSENPNGALENGQPLLFACHNQNQSGFLEFCLNIGIKPHENWQGEFGKKLRIWSKANMPKKINVLSLFTGAGGLDIGFYDAGFEIVKQIEIEEKFVKTLKDNCGKNRYFKDDCIENVDIRKYSPEENLKIDFIIGGPPCQTFSAAGRRAAGVIGTNDNRGTLFEEYVRILKKLQPIGFLFENVYGIAGADGGKAWSQISNSFMEAGYFITSRILDAADYGVPQHRERMIIVGSKKNNYRFPKPTHGQDSLSQLKHVSASEAISDIQKKTQAGKSIGGRFGHLLAEIPPGLNYSFFTERMGHPNPIFAWRSKFSDFLYKADPERPIRTLKAQGGQYTGPFHWESRPFSVQELKRLQTIPDDYKISGGQQVAVAQIGNSVPPQLARILAISVLQQIFNLKYPNQIALLEQDEDLSFRKLKRSMSSIYREKALCAITKIAIKKSVEVKKRKYFVNLSKTFKLQEKDQKHSNLIVDFHPQKTYWTINIKEKNEPKNPFQIKIEPAFPETWNLPVKTVFLKGQNQSDLVFTGLWKAFENELSLSGLKADLVQLNNYYQYDPKIAAQILFSNSKTVKQKWKPLSLITQGICVGSIFSVESLAEKLKIKKDDFLSFAKWLKKLGFEVRDSSTNPNIPKGSYLIPYAFPTLNPQSVQLRKQLSELHG